MATKSAHVRLLTYGVLHPLEITPSHSIHSCGRRREERGGAGDRMCSALTERLTGSPSYGRRWRGDDEKHKDSVLHLQKDEEPWKKEG